jgi:toluene monooxygenase system protein B
MAAFPLNSNFEGDFVIQLVAVDSEDTMDAVAEKCAYHSVGRRVTPQPDKIMRVRKHGDTLLLPRDLRVCDAGLRPTETIDVVFESA